jgi:hypothetical protein
MAWLRQPVIVHRSSRQPGIRVSYGMSPVRVCMKAPFIQTDQLGLANRTLRIPN